MRREMIVILLFIFFFNLFISNSLALTTTTIQLQDADTENLEDTHVRENDATGNYGSTDRMRITNRTGGLEARGYLKFNISTIPGGATIDEAVIYLYTPNYLPSHTMYINHIYNQTWDEDQLTWNNQLCGINFDDSVQCNLTEDDSRTWNGGIDVWNFLNITDSVRIAYSGNDDNISFIFRSSFTGINLFEFYTKEYSDATTRPYINITYSTKDIESVRGPLNFNVGVFAPQYFDVTPQDISVVTEDPPISQQFNATWNITSGNVDTVIFEFDGTNYTITNNISDVFYTTISNINEGSYQFKWYANSSSSQWNATDSFTFNVSLSTSPGGTGIIGIREFRVYPTILRLNSIKQTQIINVENTGTVRLNFIIYPAGKIKNIIKITDGISKDELTSFSLSGGENMEIYLEFDPDNINYTGNVFIKATNMLGTDPVAVNIHMMLVILFMFPYAIPIEGFLIKGFDYDFIGALLIIPQSLFEVIYIIPRINLPIHKFWVPVGLSLLFLITRKKKKELGKKVTKRWAILVILGVFIMSALLIPSISI